MHGDTTARSMHVRFRGECFEPEPTPSRSRLEGMLFSHPNLVTPACEPKKYIEIKEGVKRRKRKETGREKKGKIIEHTTGAHHHFFLAFASREGEEVYTLPGDWLWGVYARRLLKGDSSSFTQQLAQSLSHTHSTSVCVCVPYHF